jgi:hypothetical protein
MILTELKHKQNRSYQKNDFSEEFPQGRQRTIQTEYQSRTVADWIILNT